MKKLIMQFLKLKFTVLIFLVGCSLINRQENDEMNKLQGSWVNEKDSNWKLKFHGNKFIDFYNQESETCNFTINKKSCNKVYSALDAIYLNCYCKEQSCLEVTGLSNTTFAFRETSTGKLHIFKKLEE